MPTTTRYTTKRIDMYDTAWAPGSEPAWKKAPGLGEGVYSIRLFGTANVGRHDLANLATPGQLGGSQSYEVKELRSSLWAESSYEHEAPGLCNLLEAMITVRLQLADAMLIETTLRPGLALDTGPYSELRNYSVTANGKTMVLIPPRQDFRVDVMAPHRVVAALQAFRGETQYRVCLGGKLRDEE